MKASDSDELHPAHKIALAAHSIKFDQLIDQMDEGQATLQLDLDARELVLLLTIIYDRSINIPKEDSERMCQLLNEYGMIQHVRLYEAEKEVQVQKAMINSGFQRIEDISGMSIEDLMAKVIPSQTGFVCPHCLEAYGSRSGMKQHIEGHLEAGLVFPCPSPSCSLRCKSRHSLKEHLRVKHPELKGAISAKNVKGVPSI